jgi:1,4-dihydroxy-6-naphthoate synthase
MELNFAYSPCPNDTYAFHALVNNLVDCEGIKFNPILMDVEQLNLNAKQEKFPICKLSYNAYFSMCDKYIMLRSGSALGYNNGPLLVSNNLDSPTDKDIILIPGSLTTANLLLSIFFPWLNNKRELIFSQIEHYLLEKRYNYGLLIHEGRFTYNKKGLNLIADLGDLWQKEKKLPIPLGGIAINRSLPKDLQYSVERSIKRSIKYAMDNPLASKNYVRDNAQEIEISVQQKHIELFVNKYSLEIGDEGAEAIYELYTTSKKYNNLFRNSHELILT